jgi:RNA polymerase sigma factor (sigma-70 family)
MRSTETTQDQAAGAQADMVRRLKSGDQDVLNDILRTYGGLVLWKLRQAFSPAFKETDLEEIVGDALYRVWESRDSYTAERGSLLNWFMRIARNVALDYRKHGWRKAQAQECSFALEDWQVPHRDDDDQDEPDSPSAAYQDLVAILDGLEERDRSILLTYAESAGGSWTGPLVEELGMKAGALRTRAHRLIELVRRAMHERGHFLAAVAQA